MRKPALALVLGLVLCSTAHAQEVSPSKDAEIGQDANFSACSTNEECTIVEGICGNWIAINKTSEPVYDQFTRMMRAKGKCPAQSTAPRPSAVFCTNKICQIPGQTQD